MMLLVNTVLTLLHVRYAVARAYVDYIFVIIFSAKIYESYILSISLTYNLRICTCAERSERFLEIPSPILLPFANHLPALPTRLLRSVSPSDEFPSAKLRRKKSQCKKNHENHTVLVSPFSENWKRQ